MTAADLKAAIERPRVLYHWGQPYDCTPRLVTQILGNGRKFLAVRSLDDRPNYYVVRVDSGFVVPHQIDEAVYAIQDVFGDREANEYECKSHGEECPAELCSWPVWSGSSGCSWWKVDLCHLVDIWRAEKRNAVQA